DLEIPAEKASLLHDAEARVERFQRAYATGQITFGERYNKVIDAWTHANNDIADAMVKTMQRSKGGFNPVFMMFDSGSRGSRDQIRQLAGMRGLMAKPQKKLTGGIGEIIESPIKSNFREGLSVLEYFISTHGARKGLADTALKTADAGYLTRRLVDVAQDVTITEEDCGTILGLEMSALKEGEDIIEPLRERLVGCVALDEVSDPHELDEDERAKVLVEAGKLIDEETAQAIEDAGIEAVRIRSVLTCEATERDELRGRADPQGPVAWRDRGEALGALAVPRAARRHADGGGRRQGGARLRAVHLGPLHQPDHDGRGGRGAVRGHRRGGDGARGAGRAHRAAPAGDHRRPGEEAAPAHRDHPEEGREGKAAARFRHPRRGAAHRRGRPGGVRRARAREGVARGVQDARHHGRPAARGRAVRGPPAQG